MQAKAPSSRLPGEGQQEVMKCGIQQVLSKPEESQGNNSTFRSKAHRLLGLAVIGCLAISMVACGGSGAGASNTLVGATGPTPSPTPTPAPSPTPTPVPSPSPSPTPTPVSPSLSV